MAPALAMISMLAVSQKLQRNKKRNMLQYILTMLLRKRKVCKAKAFAILMIAMKARNANEVPRIRTCCSEVNSSGDAILSLLLCLIFMFCQIMRMLNDSNLLSLQIIFDV